MLLICYSIEHPINLSDFYRCYSYRYLRLLKTAAKVTVTLSGLFVGLTALAYFYVLYSILTPVFGITLGNLHTIAQAHLSCVITDLIPMTY